MASLNLPALETLYVYASNEGRRAHEDPSMTFWALQYFLYYAILYWRELVYERGGTLKRIGLSVRLLQVYGSLEQVKKVSQRLVIMRDEVISGTGYIEG